MNLICHPPHSFSLEPSSIHPSTTPTPSSSSHTQSRNCHMSWHFNLWNCSIYFLPPLSDLPRIHSTPRSSSKHHHPSFSSPTYTWTFGEIFLGFTRIRKLQRLWHNKMFKLSYSGDYFLFVLAQINIPLQGGSLSLSLSSSSADALCRWAYDTHPPSQAHSHEL